MATTTLNRVYDGLSSEQKEALHYIVGGIADNENITIPSVFLQQVKTWDSSQRKLAGAIISDVINKRLTGESLFQSLLNS